MGGQIAGIDLRAARDEPLLLYGRAEGEGVSLR